MEFLCRLYFCTEIRLNSKFVHGLNNAAKIMTQHFAQDFIDLCGVGLASETFGKLGFYH